MLFPFKKRREKENLIKTPVLITDTSLDSPNYFVINNYPNEFTSGKNAIRLYGSRRIYIYKGFRYFNLKHIGQQHANTITV